MPIRTAESFYRPLWHMAEDKMIIALRFNAGAGFSESPALNHLSFIPKPQRFSSVYTRWEGRMQDVDFYNYLETQRAERSRRLLDKHLLECDDCREKLAVIIHNLIYYRDKDYGNVPKPSEQEIITLLSRILPMADKSTIQ